MEETVSKTPDNGLEIARELRYAKAIRSCAPGTSLRHALDMILAGQLGALICIGDTQRVLASGNDGFPLNISFTANRLFELSKMDGAIVIDQGLSQILRANFHLNPDPSLPTSETGMRHRTAARMSILTQAMVISVSQRRSVVNVYLDGKNFQLRTVAELMTNVNQLLTTMQATKQSIDRSLLHLTSLELDNLVTLSDITSIFSLFELMTSIDIDLQKCIDQLGTEGKLVNMQRGELMGNIDEIYNLMIRDYAQDLRVREVSLVRKSLRDSALNSSLLASDVARALGYENMYAESMITPLGLRTLSRISVVREGMAEKILDEYGSLRTLVSELNDAQKRLNELGVTNPTVLVDSILRMRGKNENV